MRGNWPGVVSWELWQRCAEIRRGNRADRLIAVDKRGAYALSGLLTCGRCIDNVRSEELVMRDGRIDSAKPKADWLPTLEQRLLGGPTEGLVGIEPTTPALGRRRSIR